MMNQQADTLPPPQLQTSTASTSEKHAAKASNRFYQVVWRWHFYAGLFVTPIFLLVTVTGALYVFRTELTELRDRSILFVTPTQQRMSYDEMFAKAQQEVDGEEIEAIVVRAEPDRSVRFVGHAHAEGEDNQVDHHLHIYMNPYTGEVLDKRVAEDDFFAIVLDLHRSLMMGTTGRVLGELATSWGLLLLASGVYLWWPRNKKNVGVWVPRLSGKLYAVLRDWHAVAGIYLVPTALLIIFTGMFFTVVWGTAFNTTVQKAGHWPMEWFSPAKNTAPSENAKPASLDKVVATALAESRPKDNINILLAEKPDLGHKAWLIQDEDKNTYKMVAIDQYTGEMLNSMGPNEVPPLYKARMLAVSIHMGQIFGTPTKIIALITSIGLMAMVVTGIWMWWQRRPKGRTGFPRRPADGSMPRWGWLVIAASAVVLPVAGVSIALILLIDYLWNRFTSSRITGEAA